MNINLVSSLWKNYFPKVEFDEYDKLIDVVKLFYDYFESSNGNKVLLGHNNQTILHLYNAWNTSPIYVTIHIPSVQKSIALPDFKDILLIRPKEVIGCIGIAVSLVYHNMAKRLITPQPSLTSSSSSTTTATNTTTTTSIATTTPTTNTTVSSNEYDFNPSSRHTTTGSSINIRLIYPQLVDLQPFVPFHELKSESLGRLVSILGYITRVSHSQHLIIGANFSCSKCNKEHSIAFEDGIYTPPAVCPTPKCYNKVLDIIRHKIQSTDVQRIKVQEIVLRGCSENSYHNSNSNTNTQNNNNNTNTHSNSNHRHQNNSLRDLTNTHHNNNNNPNNNNTNTNNPITIRDETDTRAPRTFEFEVQGNMVNKCCIAGDIVNIIGIVKISSDKSRASFGKEIGVHHLYIDANSVTKCSATGKLDITQFNSQTQQVANNSNNNLSMNLLSHSQSQLNINNIYTNHRTIPQSQPIVPHSTTTPSTHLSALPPAAAAAVVVPSSSSSLHTTIIPAHTSHNFTPTELEMIRNIALSPQCFALLTASLCPDIYGHELVKAGFLLSLFGGTVKFSSSSSTTTSNNNNNNNNNSTNNNMTMTTATRKDENEMPVRSDIHLLVVGDPGMGKSQLLRAVSNLSNRSVLVTGHSVSTAGLTASLSKDSKSNGGSGDVLIEAGALVLADQGICCIDELDKIDCDYHALLEAMEQQSVSIAKSGVLTCLKSRAALLAAANPVNGHYNKLKTIQENLKMPAALLSRFDLIFILVDRPDSRHDQLLSEHIMRTHTHMDTTNTMGYEYNNNIYDNQMNGNQTSPSNYSQFQSQQAYGYDSSSSVSESLLQRLRRETSAFLHTPSSTQSNSKRYKPNNNDSDDYDNNHDNNNHYNVDSNTYPNNSKNSMCSTFTSLLSADILRKYIEYAKKYVHPKLSRAAAKILQKQYLTMRAEMSLGHSIPVTTRHLESMIRLSQARAKVELREEVTADDAQDVVMLLQESLLDAFTTESGETISDGRRTREGGVAKQIKSLVSIMKKECESRNGNDMFTKSEITTLCSRLRLSKDVETLIDILRTECYLILKGPQLFRLVAN